ncbi:G-protein coupled estrogen receptor 1-like protein [Lates japonicus]|uniref:G-protein coupled estrogen receptor 1-like protein n=1 Tax=Lates japonicus TaxID=270547 RepID=A0AAD3NHB1_LATJO|nr:G-protein coupled estrogen receptor 1-like protein [Lates japonicus]
MNLFQQANMYSSCLFLNVMSHRFVMLTAAAGRIHHFQLLPHLTSAPAHPAAFHRGLKLTCWRARISLRHVTRIQWLEVTLGFLVAFLHPGPVLLENSTVLQHRHREQVCLQRRPREAEGPMHDLSGVCLFSSSAGSPGECLRHPPPLER